MCAKGDMRRPRSSTAGPCRSPNRHSELGIPDVANQLGNLATLFNYQGRTAEAEGLLRRALAIIEKAFGPDHPNVATAANNLAHAISLQERLQEAEPLYRRSLAIREARFGADNPSVAVALDNLAALLHQDRRFAEAEPLARRSLTIREQSLGPAHPLVGNSLNNLASLLDNLKRHDEAAPLLKRALAVREAALGASHPEVAITVHNLASHYLDRKEWDAAYAAFKRASAIWIGRRSAGSIVSEDDQRIEMRNNSDPFLGLVVAAYHAAQSAGDAAALQLRAEAFESSQWVVGAGAASAIARMSARIASGDNGLAELVRERQDLVEHVRATDRALIAASSQLAPARSSDTEAALLQRVAASSARLKEIDAVLAARFPEYTNLTDTTPLPLADAARLVHPNEALLLFVPTKDATYLWAVTPSETRWVRIPLGSKALADHVKALRCGLDAVGEWQGDGTQRCMELTGAPRPPADSGLLPFDLARAHELYRATVWADLRPHCSQAHPSGRIGTAHQLALPCPCRRQAHTRDACRTHQVRPRRLVGAAHCHQRAAFRLEPQRAAAVCAAEPGQRAVHGFW